MKIVVLDGYTLNPGDLTWHDIEVLGDFVVYDRTPIDKIEERAAGADIIFTNKTPLTEEFFFNMPKLKYVGVLATGYNVVDLKAASKHGVVVTNIPTYGTQSVAQMVFALLLEHCHHAQHHSDAVKNGVWANSEDFCFWNYPLVELAGKTMGIIGFGRIGQQTADIASALGMNIIAYDHHRSGKTLRTRFKWVELSELLKSSDVISLHCPLFEETKGIINKESLSMMKKSAFLINTSRGPLVVDQDLADALNNEVIAGAGLDVLTVEPPSMDNPLMTAKNCIITPHISWATTEARARLMDIAASNLKAFLDNTPVNVVNKA